jgi:7-cyano-7-deazaguanine reductase
MVLQSIRNDSKFPLTIKLDCTEFTWNCPKIQQPDYGRVLIEYQPAKRIAETKSLKFYLQQYRYKNAFNEELTAAILNDFVYWIQPEWVEVTLFQNSRGGIANTCQARFDQQDDGAALIHAPRKSFQGGWAMVSAPQKSATNTPASRKKTRKESIF